METELIELRGGAALGLRLKLGNAPLLIIKASKGYAMCGYLDMKTANKLGDVAVKVTDVKSFENMLNAKIVEISEKATVFGIKEGMTSREALEKMLI